MRRRHMIVKEGHRDMTLCGHQCTRQEVMHQRKNTWDSINCKRCLQKKAYETRDARIVHTIYEHRGDHRGGVP
jgi:hypothetical protein